MHLVIITAQSYPDGGPDAARHLALAAGLAAGGHRVSFLLLHQGDLPPDRADGAIRWTSVAARHPQPPAVWRLAAVRRLPGALDAISAAAPVDAALLVGGDPVLLTAAHRAARSRGLVVLHEITEYPDIVGPQGLLGLVARGTGGRRLRSCDGVLVITRALQDWVGERTSAPTLLFGSLVDLTIHQPFPPLELTDTLVVGYAGSLSQGKDGVLTLLEAVAAAVAALAPALDVRLEILGGDLASPEGRTAVRTSERLDLSGHVRFHGQVPYGHVRGHLRRCHLLALPRPASRQATGGFPTKLGEYLATGRPVLTTAVGEIPRHLRGGQHCVMVAPNDADALARGLIDIASDYREAQAIGTRGRALAEGSFAAPVLAGKLAAFVDRLTGGGPR